MYSKFQLARKYLHYYFTAANGKGHGIHSPFVYRFVRDLLIDSTNYPEYNSVENLRSRLKQDQQLVDIEDLGAGSALSKSRRRTVASIARHAAKSKKLAQLLFRISQNFQPANILELGTSLGISTTYLAKGNPAAKVITIEGSRPIAELAQANFISLGLNNIESVTGNFDLVLPEILNRMPTVDLAFIDGNHRLQPTLSYFEQIMEKVNNDSLIIFDDIHWSAEMEEAWKQIQQDSRVRISIDLFFIGLVFFRKESREAQHFTVRF